jgi:hypothetical protein
LGTEVQLADGTALWALLGNVDPDDPRAMRHFLTLSLWIGGAWFHLARYHDVTYEEHGPSALAAALGRPVASIFPIAYDVRELALGDRHALAGQVLATPMERLSRAELIEWAVRSR